MTHPRAAADFVVVDARSGRVLRSGTVPFLDVAAQTTAPHEIVLECPHEDGTDLDLDALADGRIVFRRSTD